MDNFLPQIDYDVTKRNEPSGWKFLQLSTGASVQGAYWRRTLANVGHVAPLREPVPRFSILGRTSAAPQGTSPGGEALLQLLRRSREGPARTKRLVDLIDYWIGRRFHLLKTLRVVDVQRAARVFALVADERRGFEAINIANMGEGISQLLPIIASVIMLADDGTLLVEQPEIHLHPRAQADLGDLLISGIEKGKRQLIVETHSEHVLLRVRRRIAEGKLDADHVVVLFVEKPGRAAHVRPLDLDETGAFDQWPEGFFDEAYQEALHLSMATPSR